jgi:uncharacterized protein (TIGR02284 family)
LQISRFAVSASSNDLRLWSNAMSPNEFDRATLSKIQKLIEANFAGRDELYAAADSLDDEARQRVCQRLAENLAGRAIELQQIVTACGVEPAEPLDTLALAHALFDLAKVNRGESGVLDAAAEGEQNLKHEYDRAIEETTHPKAEQVLRRHREQAEFGEQVIRGMKGGNPRKPSDGETR